MLPSLCIEQLNTRKGYANGEQALKVRIISETGEAGVTIARSESGTTED